MCRRMRGCTQLGSDSSTWSKACPLPPLPWFESQLNILQESISLMAGGFRDESLALLSTMRSVEMQEWSIEHGQMSGTHRAGLLGHQEPQPVDEEFRDKQRSPRKHEEAVFSRDGHRCRYCGIRLVSNSVLVWFSNAVGDERFQKGKSNLTTHGAIHIFKPVADHVVPWRLGGMTAPENLVTACGPCNYGKYSYTIEQIGIQNPFDRAPVDDDWDGLMRFLPSRQMVEASA